VTTDGNDSDEADDELTLICISSRSEKTRNWISLPALRGAGRSAATRDADSETGMTRSEEGDVVVVVFDVADDVTDAIDPSETPPPFVVAVDVVCSQRSMAKTTSHDVPAPHEPADATRETVVDSKSAGSNSTRQS
jgi:hypothetical protein